ncbi:MAG: GntR family transcriptional regulator [Pirellulales bacterium]
MQIRISSDDGSPIYLQIVNQIKYLVAAGRYGAGDRLPPVRKLAEQLLVNPNTVARAYRELESAGLITTRQGSGTTIADHGSPLANSEKVRILTERIDMLLAESSQLEVPLETLLKLIRQRQQTLQQATKKRSISKRKG